MAEVLAEIVSLGARVKYFCAGRMIGRAAIMFARGGIVYQVAGVDIFNEEHDTFLSVGVNQNMAWQKSDCKVKLQLAGK